MFLVIMFSTFSDHKIYSNWNYYVHFFLSLNRAFLYIYVEFTHPNALLLI